MSLRPEYIDILRNSVPKFEVEAKNLYLPIYLPLQACLKHLEQRVWSTQSEIIHARMRGRKWMRVPTDADGNHGKAPINELACRHRKLGWFDSKLW